MSKVEIYNVKQAFMPFNDYLTSDDHAFISVTEWNNGEGHDIEISNKDRQRFSLTDAEWQALQFAMMSIQMEG